MTTTRTARLGRLAVGATLLLLACAAAGAQDQSAILRLKNQIIDLQNRGALSFKDVSLCSKVIGFGSYVPLPEPAISQGGELLLYYEPVNVFTNRVQGQYEIWYTQDIVLESGDGEVLYEQEDLLAFHYYSRSPVFDLFATNSLTLGNLPPGDYVYRAVLKDQLKEARAEMSLPFRIVP
ncbi:MAG: hypothetical protein JW820_04445 [Spirochaetales bacterium]|nr:hypothetical protein [Spirochaetales bacterium]